MQHSIFEPLICLQAHNMEECLQALPIKQTFTSQAAAPSLFSISPPSPPSSLHAFNTRDNSPFDHTISCSLHAQIITLPPSSSHYNKARSEHDLTSDNLTHFNLPLSAPTLSATSPPPCSNPKLPLSHSTTFFTPRAPITACSNKYSDDGRKHVDDGSVAIKLFSSITKSISSPSLHLQSCKEAARETPYQKTLKLKQMKLQHCAEALGMESSDNSSFIYDNQCIHQEKIDMIGNPSSCPPSFTLPNSHQESSLKSVQSAPNLSSALPLMINHSSYTRSTSFPPPLSHTLPTSSSYDSLSLSLRAYREDGRFILKETMVPSKHYFHANRRNGRLTLHVLTRELIEEESFASQDDHEDFSKKDCQGRDHIEGEEEEILESMQVSLNEETMEEGLYSKEEYSTNTTQSLSEVCVKENLGMEDTSKEVNIAASHLNMSLQSSNCLAIHNNKKKESEDDDKRNGEMIDFGQLRRVAKSTTRRSCPISSESQRNVISNVITLSLQTSSHSKVNLRKAQVLSFPHLSSYPLVSAGTLKQSTLIHSTERSHGLLPSNHDMGTCTQSNENFIWQSNIMHRAVASGSPRKQRKGGGGGGSGGATFPALVMEEVRANGLMNVVSELATSLTLEASYGRGNWCLAGKKKPLISAVVESGAIGTIVGGYASAIKGGDEGQISDAANFGYNTFNEEDKVSEDGGIKELNITQFPSSNANLQSELEWLHTLHCKELFDRNQLGQGLMKLHCISTRS